jgi:hypothetical protein
VGKERQQREGASPAVNADEFGRRFNNALEHLAANPEKRLDSGA